MAGVIRAIDLRVVATIGAIVIVSLAVLAALYRGEVRLLSLGEEFTIPAAVSGLLLLAAAVAALLVARLWSGSRAGARAALALACFFAFMALDEMLFLHERLETWTGIDWQVLYLPVALIGGVAWLMVLRRLFAYPHAAGLFVAGAAAWVVSQAIELVQWNGDVLVYPWLNFPEETLEMTGSLLFALGLLAGLQAWMRVPAPALAPSPRRGVPARTA